MEQNKINLIEKKNELYVNTFSNKFNIRKESLNKLKDDLKKVYFEYESKMVEAKVKSRNLEWISNEDNIFNENLNKVYLNNYKRILSESVKNSVLEVNDISSLVNLLREYSLFILEEADNDKDRLPEKIMTVDSFQNYKDDEAINMAVQSVKVLIKTGMESSINLNNLNKDIINISKECIGISNYDNIMDLDLKLKGLIPFNDLKANFDMNSKDDCYYDTTNDVTYFFKDDVYLKAFGKYESIDELIEEHPDLEEEIEDTNGLRRLVNDPTQFSVYQNKQYYYRVNNEFYKSNKYFSRNNLEYNFFEYETDLTRISPLSEKVSGNLIQVADTKPTYIDANKVRDYAKTNVKTILNNIRGKELTKDSKEASFSLLKDSLKTFEEATKYEIDNLPWYKRIIKFIIKPIYNRSINSLTRDVKQTLGLTNREFSDMYNSLYSADVFDQEKELVSSIKSIKTTDFELGKYINSSIDDLIVDTELDHNTEVTYNISKDEMEIDLDKKAPIEIDELNESLDLGSVDSGMREKDEKSINNVSSSK